MSELRLAVMKEELGEELSCGVDSIDQMIRNAFAKTLFKQGLAYNILVDGCLVGSCMIKFVWLMDENEEYYEGDKEFIALEISYLAIDLRVQGHKFGSKALDALICIAKKIASELPVRFLVIDALKKWESWYTKVGFQPYPKVEDLRYPDCIPMRMDLMDREQAERYAETY